MSSGVSNAFGLSNRRTVRAEVNEMDKCTIVSIYPRPLAVIKLTVTPNRFVVEPGNIKVPSVLAVGPSSWWREVDEDQPLMEITNGSVQMANGIVNDWMNGMLGCNMADSKPGVFWVKGNFTSDEVKKKHPELLSAANAAQTKYYHALLNMADGLWAKAPGNPLAISEDMRMAAKELGIQGKDWMSNFTQMENVRCVACGQPRNPQYPICPSCHTVVDTVKFKELGLMVAPEK